MKRVCCDIVFKFEVHYFTPFFILTVIVLFSHFFPTKNLCFNPKKITSKLKSNSKVYDRYSLTQKNQRQLRPQGKMEGCPHLN